MSQGSSVETLLNSAREILKSLGDSVEHLAQEYPEVFKNPDLASRLESFQATYQEATQRLQTPRLSIATIGTTSSGKSTIVNALIGRKLAPIEAGEMSGGVLTLRHAADSRLVVEPTEGASWQTGEWKDLTDEEIYDRVRDGVMLPYHQKRRGQSKKIIEAPQVTVFGPLLPGVDQSILGLPPGVGIEFIDLPGIKSVQDRTNLAVIQGRVQKSFSLVALDYLQVDDEHRKRLLEELKEVVSFLRGRTESMLFILNRVDQRGGDDLPLEERIASLRKEIKKQLQLQEQPDVLPFSARLLYYAQCSVGLGEALNVSNEKRLEFLQKLFFDCAKEIKGRVSGNKELRRWIRNIEDQVEDEEEVSTADLQKLLDYVYDWSGGRKLWRKLSIRVRESFPELVLLPTLMPILKSYDALSTSIDTIAKIRQIQYGEQVEAKQKEIAHTRKKIKKEIKRIRNKFQNEVSEMIDLLKTNTSESRSIVVQKAEEQGLSGFQALITAVNDVEGDVTKEIIVPMRSALMKNQPRHVLEDEILGVAPPNITEELAKAYDEASRRLIKFKEDGDFLTRKVLQDDTEAISELDQDEKAIRRLFLNMRRTITVRAEYKLQTKAKQLEEALSQLIKSVECQLISLCTSELPDVSTGDAIIADYSEQNYYSFPTLPSKFFQISPDIKRGKTKEKKVVGKEYVTEVYDSGSCFNSKKKRTVEKDKKKTFHYQTVELPGISVMTEAWSEGIQKGKEELWDILCGWMTQRLDEAIEQFNESVDKVIELADHALNEQLEILTQDYEAEFKKWCDIEELKIITTSLKSKLDETSRTQGL